MNVGGDHDVFIQHIFVRRFDTDMDGDAVFGESHGI
jgi:hypothetical protein